jgi:hypothetical protein
VVVVAAGVVSELGAELVLAESPVLVSLPQPPSSNNPALATTIILELRYFIFTLLH